MRFERPSKGSSRKVLQRTKFPTDRIALLQQHGNGAVPFTLEALKQGRFNGLAPFSASAFRKCRPPVEAHTGFLLYAGFGPQSHSPSLAGADRAAGWETGSNWHHSGFVEFASAARAGRDKKKLEIAQAIQRLEWKLLFECCAKEMSE